MKLHYISTSLLTALLISSSIAHADVLDTRVDFYDHADNLLYSTYASNGGYLFTARQPGGNDDTPWYIDYPLNGYGICNNYGSLDHIKFVPPGVYSYPCSVNTGAAGVTCYYEVLPDDSNAPENAAPRTTSSDVLSGATIRIHMKLPKDQYPAFDLCLDMSRTPIYEWMEENGAISYHSLYMENKLADGYADQLFNSHPVYSLNPDYRKSIYDNLDSYGGFQRIDGSDNEWFYDFTMPNEPIRIYVYGEKRDSDLLKNITLSAIRELYQQNWINDINQLQTGDFYFQEAIGNSMSQDCISTLMESMDVGYGWRTMNYALHSNYYASVIPWSLAYQIITHANIVLEQIDKFTLASQQERDWARAQMLALRSHAYTRLLQVFGKRWSESDNGNAYCAPLETKFDLSQQPLATMRRIADQCYADLDEAIRILSAVDIPTDECHVSLEAAKGLKMRVALLREDWWNAYILAKDVMRTATLTSNEDLKAGFSAKTPSWLWSISDTSYISGVERNHIYYWSCFGKTACNGVYAAMWNIGCQSVDKDFYLQIPQADIRASLFVMPGQIPTITATLNRFNKWINWYEPWDYIHNYPAGCQQMMAAIYNTGTKGASKIFCKAYLDRTPEGIGDPAFCSNYGNGNSDDAEYVPVRFGSSLKFYGRGSYCGGEMLLMRTEEILLSMAEAAYHLDYQDEARKAIFDLNILRNPVYAFTGEGEDLLEEIRFTRRMELWSEGFGWYDFKRWSLPIERREYVPFDTESGNWSKDVVGDISLPVNASNGWRFVIPNLATKYNPAIDINLMDYSEYILPEQQNAPTKGLSPAKSFTPAKGLAPTKGFAPAKGFAPDKQLHAPILDCGAHEVSTLQ